MSKHETCDDLNSTPPSKGEFKIQQKPDGAWRLTHYGTDMGTYETREAAEDGMMRIIFPQVFEYDEHGKLI